MSIRAKIKEYMDEKDISQKDLGEKIGWSGDRVGKALRGDRPLRTDDLELMVKSLGIDLTELLQNSNMVPVVVKFTPGERFLYSVVNSEKLWEGQVTVPPGFTAQEAQNLYAIELAKKSITPAFREGTVFYCYRAGYGIQPEDKDFVVFVADDGTACLKQVNLSNDSIILRSLDPSVPEVVKPKQYLHALDTVCCIKRPDPR